MLQETYLSIFLRFLRFGCLAWGGPVAQIAMMRKELVEEEKWVTAEQFNRVLAVYQVLPGPEATELCIYFGMYAKGRPGGLIAGAAFVFPGFMLMLLLTALYSYYGLNDSTVISVFNGIHAAVIALIGVAAFRLGKHVATNYILLAIIAVSALMHAFLPFYFVLPLAGGFYFFYRKRRMLLSGLVVLISSVLIVIQLISGTEPDQLQDRKQNESIKATSTEIIISGFKTGALTFGGAYTAIPFLKEDAVDKHSWVSEKQFLDGIALSGIVPAPLIIFSTFVGYFAHGLTGAILITLAVFLPAFVITLSGHSILDKVIAHKPLHDLLDGITAGVIGLISYTAVSLFISTITGLQSLIVFLISITLLIIWKSRITTIAVILLSGLAAYFFRFL